MYAIVLSQGPQPQLKVWVPQGNYPHWLIMWQQLQ